jgi:hypothetical protein
MLNPADPGMLGHPAIQPLLAHVSEGHAVATANAPEREVTLASKQHAKRQTQGRTLRIAPVVMAEAARRPGRRLPTGQQASAFRCGDGAQALARFSGWIAQVPLVGLA